MSSRWHGVRLAAECAHNLTSKPRVTHRVSRRQFCPAMALTAAGVAVAGCRTGTTSTPSPSASGASRDATLVFPEGFLLRTTARGSAWGAVRVQEGMRSRLLVRRSQAFFPGPCSRAAQIILRRHCFRGRLRSQALPRSPRIDIQVNERVLRGADVTHKPLATPFWAARYPGHLPAAAARCGGSPNLPSPGSSTQACSAGSHSCCSGLPCHPAMNCRGAGLEHETIRRTG
jgi:hypothetical protein